MPGRHDLSHVQLLLAQVAQTVAKGAGRGYDRDSIEGFIKTPRARQLATDFLLQLRDQWCVYLDATVATPAQSTTNAAVRDAVAHWPHPGTPGTVSKPGTPPTVRPYQFPNVDDAPRRTAMPAPGQPESSPTTTPLTPPPTAVVNPQPANPTLAAAVQNDSGSNAPLTPAISPHPAPTPPTRNHPPVRFTLPNAKAGQDYDGALGWDLADTTHIRIISITVPAELSLRYAPATGKLFGVPAKDGEFEVQVGYRFTDEPESAAVRLATLQLVVTPDPRSLWKNLPSDPSIPFWKQDSDSRIVIGTHRRIVAASQRGRSHAHKGSCRDDDFYIDDVAGWSIAIVADGAGSAKFSRRGAQVATREAGSFLAQVLAAEGGAKILEAAAKHAASPTSETEQLFKTSIYETAGYAAHTALKAMNKEVEAALARGLSMTLRDLDTTLLVAISHPVDNGVLVGTYWVGDGAIAICRKSEDVVLCGSPDSGEFSGGTRFLAPAYVAQAELWNRTNAYLLPSFDALMLLSDGVSDPKFPSEAALSKTSNWNSLRDELAQEVGFPDKVDGIEGRLLQWLDFWVTGEHDDRTIAIVW